MLYKDIDKETARQCCREHTVFNDKRHKESDCEHCPFRRDFKDLNGKIHKGICWFVLMRGLEYVTNTPYAQAEKAILEQEHVSYPLEWLEWLKTHSYAENLVSWKEWKAAKKERDELAEKYANGGEQK